VTVTYPIIKITIGEEELTFENEEVISATLIEEFSPISAEIPISTIEFRIISTDTSFSMFEGEYFELLSERLPVEVSESIDGVTNLLGNFYLSEWKNVSDYEFEFKAMDVIGVLDATDYDGNFWSTGTAISTIMSDMLDPLNILYTLDATLGADTLQGWIPPGTYREALQQICFAGAATAITSRSNRLLIDYLVLPDNIYDIKILDSEKLMEQSVELLPLVTSVELVSHDYEEGEDSEDIFSEELAIGTHKIVFEQPYFDLVVTGPGYTPTVLASEGGDYIMSEGNDYIEAGGEYIFGPNSLYLELTVAGLVEVTGTPWLDSKRGFVVEETGLNEYANKNALKIAEATLINSTIAPAIVATVQDYYRQRYLKTITILPSETKIGDIVLTGTLYDKMILGTVEKIQTNLVGGYIAEVEIVGIQYPGVSMEPETFTMTGTDATLTYSEE